MKGLYLLARPNTPAEVMRRWLSAAPKPIRLAMLPAEKEAANGGGINGSEGRQQAPRRDYEAAEGVLRRLRARGRE